MMLGPDTEATPGAGLAAEAARAAEELLAARMRALTQARLPAAWPDARWIRDWCHKQPRDLPPDARAHVAALCWRYRKFLAPRSVAPRLNPLDPIVREMRLT